jgi:hypothetical protein
MFIGVNYIRLATGPDTIILFEGHGVEYLLVSLSSKSDPAQVLAQVRSS